MNYESTISASELEGYAGSESEQRARTKRRWIIAAVIVGLLLIAAAIAFALTRGPADGGKTAAAADDKKDASQSVTVVAPGNDTVLRTINATGTLGAQREIPVGVVGEGGRVVRVFVDAGAWVKKGQTLISIDRSVQTQEAASLRAQIGVSRADLQLAENELQRALKLVDRGFISKADVDRKTATRDAAHARVHVAVAQLGAQRARTARLNIRAPVGGYILERNVEPGQTVSAGSGMLFRIAQGGQMELRAQLAESDLAVVSQGVAATVTPVGTDRQFTGRIWQISPMIDAQSRQGIARIALPFDRALRPGGFASVRINAGASTAPVLPESAVHNDKKGSFVYIVGKDDKVVRRDVTTGTITDKGLAITKGLKGTERVILYAGGFLNPGETINPVLQKKVAE